MEDDLIDDETLATNLQQLNGQINETFCEPDGGAVGEHCAVGSETIAQSFMQLSGQTHGDCREPVGGTRRETFADRLLQISRCPPRPCGADEEEIKSKSHVPPVFSPPESLLDTAYDRMLQKQKLEEDLGLCNMPTNLEDKNQGSDLDMYRESTVVHNDSLEFDSATQHQQDRRKLLETTQRNHRIMRALLDQADYLQHVQVYGGVRFGSQETKDLMTVEQRPKDRCPTDTYFATNPMRPWSLGTLDLRSGVSDTTIVRQDE